MSNNHPQDIFQDQSASRSPGAQRYQTQQTLHRQPSRQFDVYGQMPNPLFAHDDHNQRFEPNRFDRLGTAGLPSAGYSYDMNGPPQTWNPSAFSNPHPLGAFGATGRLKAAQRGRGPLPSVSFASLVPTATTQAHQTQTWLDQPPPSMGGMNSFGAMGPPPVHHPLRNDSFSHDTDEELIPTAIVIKNIPFAVKKEQLVELMTQMNLPLPYAFNYHFDNGVFRGLAFANFTSADETAAVIEHLNHFELQGRKLRVEYKKMLPIQERERIEREKRERRGQLEEQHRPMAQPSLQNQASMSSIGSHIPATSPSPVSARNSKLGNGFPNAISPFPNLALDIDLNDPQTLQFYSQLLLFKDDHSREALVFPSSLTPQQRRIVHTIAHHMQLSHVSRGNGDQRQVHVVRANDNNISPPLPQGQGMNDASRRALNRAGPGDFSDARGSDPGMYGTFRGQGSGLLGIPDSPSGMNNQQNLRAARSVADLRSYTPSPVPSSASFPAALQSNIARFQDMGPGSVASTTPTLTPTASGNALGPHRDEGLPINGLGSLSIGSSIAPTGGSPRRLRGMFSWDENHQGAGHAGPIGSHRNFSMTNFDEPSSRDRLQTLPMRQPRGPAVERNPGFARAARPNGHQARGSDELRQQNSSVEIIVE